MKQTNVLIIGGGGREGSIAWRIKQSPHVGKIYVAPGNPGTAMLGCYNLPFSPDRGNFELIRMLAIREGVGLVIVGPDNALADGIVDCFKNGIPQIPVFGPSAQAAQIESSKVFAKRLMKKAGIPTADFEVFTGYQAAVEYARERGGNVVIKADGLALGKGVKVCSDMEEVKKALYDFMVTDTLNGAGKTVIIEEKLEGVELSVHALSDGVTFKLFPPVRDHKHLLAGNKGPMTGGMGVFGPIDIDPGLMEQIEDQVVRRCIQTLEGQGTPFIGCLYPGLMLTKEGPKVLEFNARFGDPETQAFMRLLANDVDFFEVLLACAQRRLNEVRLRWKSEKCHVVTLTAEGYPNNPRKGDVIGIDSRLLSGELDDLMIFQAGTRWDNGRLVTNGGRVLNVTQLIKSPDEIPWAYQVLKSGQITFQNMHYRDDIGKVA